MTTKKNYLQRMIKKGRKFLINNFSQVYGFEFNRGSSDVGKYFSSPNNLLKDSLLPPNWDLYHADILYLTSPLNLKTEVLYQILIDKRVDSGKKSFKFVSINDHWIKENLFSSVDYLSDAKGLDLSSVDYQVFSQDHAHLQGKEIDSYRLFAKTLKL